MISIKRHDSEQGSVIMILLHDVQDEKRLEEVFNALATGAVGAVDLVRENGFVCSGLKAFALSTTSQMRFEGVVRLQDGEVRWDKTAEGWLEASELLRGLAMNSHQYLGEGDARIEVQFGAG